MKEFIGFYDKNGKMVREGDTLKEFVGKSDTGPALYYEDENFRYIYYYKIIWSEEYKDWAYQSPAGTGKLSLIPMNEDKCFINSEIVNYIK